MNYWQEVKNLISQKLEVDDLLFSYPTDLSLGELSLNCFVQAKKNNQNPAELAAIWAKKLQEDEQISNYFSEIKVVGPYINFFLSINLLANRVITEVKEKKDKYGCNDEGNDAKVMIEFSNGNTHKEYHVGHLRNISYGDSISNILDAMAIKLFAFRILMILVYMLLKRFGIGSITPNILTGLNQRVFCLVNAMHRQAKN